MLFECNTDGTVGGSHKALHDLAVTMDQARFEPVVVFQENNSYVDVLRQSGIEVHNIAPMVGPERALRAQSARPRRFLNMLGAVLRRARFLRSNRIDLVHLNNTPMHGGADWAPAARMLRIPVMSSVMGWLPGTLPRRWRLIFRLFDKVLPVSTIVADRWIELGVPQERVRVIHHGVDSQAVRARCTQPRERVREEFGVLADDILVVMGGNVREWKGQHVVLESLTLLEPSYLQRLRLLFAGAASPEDQEYYQRLREFIIANSLSKRVDFLGFRKDLPDLLVAADIVLHASITPEPGGIVVMEAMALGAATIAAARGGHTEVMIPGCGLTFDTDHPEELATQLKLLMDDPKLRQELGNQARERVAAFDLERNARETQEVYDDLLRNRPTGN